MDINLEHDKVRFAKNVLAARVPREETADVIVPDSLPDIARIIDTDANVLVRGKDSENGRVTVSGIVSATVVYVPDGSETLRRVAVELPFEVAAAGTEVAQATRVVARVNLSSADAIVVNPRKISVRAELIADITGYNDAELALPVGFKDGAEPTESGTQLLKDTFSFHAATDVREKTFSVTDEYAIPNTSPAAAELLRANVTLTPDESKLVGNKLIFKGAANVRALYARVDNNEPMETEFKLDFSQIMELENAAADDTFELVPQLTGAYFDLGGENETGRVITAELHAVAQCVATGKKTVPFLTDAYSTRFELAPRRDFVSVEDNAPAGRFGAVLRANLVTPPGVARVVSVTARAGNVTNAYEDNTATLRCPVNVSAVYVNSDGQVQSANGRFEAELNANGANVNARAECGGEVYAVAAEGGIEVRVPVEFTAHEVSRLEVSPISGLSYDEETPTDTKALPSLVLARANEGETLWQLAKKHRSTTELIREANDMEENDAPASGKFLVIPKKR
ncbi:MAG: DUF3794 domain-containing protein [Oscillospiraceae bacterium]|jgi:hypothetical protein|nr:DUF3794 domain-containing protein [Oscillospiraceae bacterium]